MGDFKQQIKDEMFLVSNIFHKNNQRYTGVWNVDKNGKMTNGMNLEEHEWAELMNNFSKIKSVLGKQVNNYKKSCKRALDYNDHDDDEYVELFQVIYYLGKDVYKYSTPKEYRSMKSAEIGAEKNKPVEGDDFDFNTGKITYKIKPITKLPPLPTTLMQVLYYYLLQIEVQKVKEEKCEGCNIEHGSQIEHLGPKGCLNPDEDLLFENTHDAKKRIGEHQLIVLFDTAMKKLKCSPICTFPYATSAKTFLSVKDFIDMKKNEDILFFGYLKDLALEVIDQTDLPESAPQDLTSRELSKCNDPSNDVVFDKKEQGKTHILETPKNTFSTSSDYFKVTEESVVAEKKKRYSEVDSDTDELDKTY